MHNIVEINKNIFSSFRSNYSLVEINLFERFWCMSRCSNDKKCYAWSLLIFLVVGYTQDFTYICKRDISVALKMIVQEAKTESCIVFPRVSWWAQLFPKITLDRAFQSHLLNCFWYLRKIYSNKNYFLVNKLFDAQYSSYISISYFSHRNSS